MHHKQNTKYNNERVEGVEVEWQRTTNQLFPKGRKFYLKKTIKKNQKIDSEWWGGFFLVLGLLVMLSSFAFFILSAYIAPWFALIGVGTLLVGFFISALYVPIVNEKESWLGPILMTCYALVWGGVSMIIWGVVELIKWIIK